ncbi:BrnT family toxin [Caenispirillum bisanense]|uniref:BrnT family toxin n=1 Tax=Caenispirillum bisanense TaxID=414052 RepID=UPI0031E00763
MYDAFEWDAGRSRANAAAHGIDLESAATIFDGPVLARPDDRAAYGERRFIGVGASHGVELTIVFTVRSPRLCRIVSARRAHGREREAYHQAVAHSVAR